MNTHLIGPFTQALTLRGLPLMGPLSDELLEVVPNAGVLIKGERIIEVGLWSLLLERAKQEGYVVQRVEQLFEERGLRCPSH